MMKVSMRNGISSMLAVVLCLVCTVLVCSPNAIGKEFLRPNDLRSIPMRIVSGIPIWVPGISSDDPLLPETAEGKEQLVQALDASIARIIDSGKWREIVNSDPAVSPLVVNIGDCYPRIEDEGNVIYPFPSNPVGLLKDILDNKRVRIGDYDVNDPFVPGTFHVFDTVNPAIMRAIIDELGKGYGISPSPDPGAIEIVSVYIWPPSSALMFEGLNNGDFDIIGFNAALGATVSVDGVEKRRRDVARFTCTVFGTNWYIHVRNDSNYQTIDDVIADATADLCVGQLSSRLSGDYFKNAASIAKQFTDDDLVICSDGVRDGTYDAYLHFDPVPLSYPCVSEEIYGDHADETELLRKFRDEVLSKTPTGQEIITLYYQWSPTIVKAMRKDTRFTLQVKTMLDGIIPIIGGKKQ